MFACFSVARSFSSNRRLFSFSIFMSSVDARETEERGESKGEKPSSFLFPSLLREASCAE